MALNGSSGGSKKDPASKGVPKVSEGHDDDTETAIETPFAREQRGKGEGDSADDANATDAPDSQARDRKAEPSDPSAKAKKIGESAGAVGASARKGKATSALESAGPWLVPVYLLSLLLLLVGERVVPSEDALRYAFSALGVLGIVATTAVRARTAFGGSDERSRVERTLTYFMIGGALAIGLYFATTEAGRNLLGFASMKPETRARLAGALTIGWTAALTMCVSPLIFGEMAIAPMRRAAHFEARRVRSATIAGATLAFAATYVALFTYAAGESDQKLDFSYYRTSRPGESTKNLAKTLSEPIEVTAFFRSSTMLATRSKGTFRSLHRRLRRFNPSTKIAFSFRRWRKNSKWWVTASLCSSAVKTKSSSRWGRT
ncbi:MAG: hypothetical protein IPK82_33045 [Polyangiaceae bacterium]|nr:hypothetical protein [Polyangiaceae bacterium]